MKKFKYFPLMAVLVLFMACSEEEPGPDPTAPTGTVTETLTVEAGMDVTLTGTINDEQGLTNVTISNTNLGLSDVETLDGETTYSFELTITVPIVAPPGNYSVVVTASNIEGLSTTFNVVITVTPAICRNEMDVFSGASTARVKSTWEGYTEWVDGYSDITLSIDGDQLTMVGDWIYWWETTGVVTLVPDAEDVTMGTVEFGTEPIYLVDHNSGYSDGNYYEGYDYFVMLPQPDSLADISVYDACEGVVSLVFNVGYRETGTEGDIIFEFAEWTDIHLNE